MNEEQFCYLTTTGRKSGKQHTIEIWYAVPQDSNTIYMLAGGGYGADWVKNIEQDAQVSVRIGAQNYLGRGRIIQPGDEEQLARRLVVKKYYGRDQPNTTGWDAESLPLAVDLET